MVWSCSSSQLFVWRHLQVHQLELLCPTLPIGGQWTRAMKIVNTCRTSRGPAGCHGTTDGEARLGKALTAGSSHRLRRACCHLCLFVRLQPCSCKASSCLLPVLRAVLFSITSSNQRPNRLSAKQIALPYKHVTGQRNNWYVQAQYVILFFESSALLDNPISKANSVKNNPSSFVRFSSEFVCYALVNIIYVLVFDIYHSTYLYVYD